MPQSKGAWPTPPPQPSQAMGGRQWKGRNLCVGGAGTRGRGNGPPTSPSPGPPPWQTLPKAKRAPFSWGMGPWLLLPPISLQLPPA